AQAHVGQGPNEKAAAHEIPFGVARAHFAKLLLAQGRLRPKLNVPRGQLLRLWRKARGRTKVSGRDVKGEMEARKPEAGCDEQSCEAGEDSFGAGHNIVNDEYLMTNDEGNPNNE